MSNYMHDAVRNALVRELDWHHHSELWKSNLEWGDLRFDGYMRAIYRGEGCWYDLDDVTEEAAFRCLFEWGYFPGIAEKDYVFENHKLVSIRIPEGITKIRNEAFYGCVNLKAVILPDGITKIGNSAFKNCPYLTSINIPDSVTEIGEDAFSECEYLADENGFVIVRNVLYSYYGNAESVIIPDGVKKIGNRAFAHCKNLKNVTISDGVTEIGNEAFTFCKNLKDVSISDGVAEIGNKAFMFCENLTNVNIPNSVKKIGDMAFCDCFSLANKNIIHLYEHPKESRKKQNPKSIEKIDISSLYSIHHSALKDVSLYECIKNSVGNVSIHDPYRKFADENGFTIDNNILYSYCGKSESVVVPDGVTKIGYEAFKNFTNIVSISIPHGVTEIDCNAFENCLSLTSINIPNGVTKIKSFAFCNCEKLTSISIPDSVTEINETTFYLCKDLTIYAPSGSYAEQYAAENGIKFSSTSQSWLRKKTNRIPILKNLIKLFLKKEVNHEI